VGLDGGGADGVSGHRFRVRLDDWEEVVADAVVAAPGVRYFQNVPDWSAGLPSSASTGLSRWTSCTATRCLGSSG